MKKVTTKDMTVLAVGFLEGAGMKKYGTFRGAHVLYLPGDEADDLFRFFIPQIMSRGSARELYGVLGSMKKEAFVHWRNIKNLADYYVISIFSQNFRELGCPPLFGRDLEVDAEFCKTIVHILSSLPVSQEAVDKLEREDGAIFGVKVRTVLLSLKLARSSAISLS